MADDKRKQKRIKFTREDVLDLLGLVNNENPFADPENWVLIVDTLKQRRPKEFTLKNVREKVLALIKEFRERDRVQQVTSGREEYDELDQHLQTASDLKKEFADGNPVLKKRKPKRDQKEGKKIRAEAALEAYRMQEKNCLSEAYTLSVMDVADESLLLDDDILPSTDGDANQPSTSSALPNPEKPTLSSDPVEPPITPHLTKPSLLDDPVYMPVRTLMTGKKKKTSLEKECWKKLAADRKLQIKKLNLETIKAENERRKLEVEHEVELKKIKFQEHQLNLLKEHAELLALASENFKKTSQEDRDLELKKIKMQEDQIQLMKQLSEELKNCITSSQCFQEKILQTMERLLDNKHFR